MASGDKARPPQKSTTTPSVRSIFAFMFYLFFRLKVGLEGGKLFRPKSRAAFYSLRPAGGRTKDELRAGPDFGCAVSEARPSGRPLRRKSPCLRAQASEPILRGACLYRKAGTPDLTARTFAG